MFCGQHPDCLAELKIDDWLRSRWRPGSDAFLLLPSNSVPNTVLLLELSWRGSRGFLQRVKSKISVQSSVNSSNLTYQHNWRCHISDGFVVLFAGVCTVPCSKWNSKAGQGAAGWEQQGRAFSPAWFQPCMGFSVQGRMCPPGAAAPTWSPAWQSHGDTSQAVLPAPKKAQKSP